MSLSCDLYIDTTLTFIEFLRQFFAWNDIDIEMDVRLNTMFRQPFAVAMKEGSFVVFSEPAEQRAIDSDALGIYPTINLHFCITNSSCHRAHEVILCMLINVLKQIEGDAALIHGNGHVVMLRKRRTLTLNMEADFWTVNRLTLVDVPFQLKNLPQV